MKMQADVNIISLKVSAAIELIKDCF